MSDIHVYIRIPQRMLKDSSKHTTLQGPKGAELPIMQHAAKASGIAVGQAKNLGEKVPSMLTKYSEYTRAPQ